MYCCGHDSEKVTSPNSAILTLTTLTVPPGTVIVVTADGLPAEGVPAALVSVLDGDGDNDDDDEDDDAVDDDDNDDDD